MPHFIVDCSPQVLALQPAENILREVHAVAEEAEIFNLADIKVRIRSFANYSVAGGNDEFIHVFAYIMQGRTVEQRSALSRAVVGRLMALLPDVPVVSMNVSEFEKATYCNRRLLEQG